MTETTPSQRLLARLKQARETAAISSEDLADDLILGPGWVERFESGEIVPDLDTLFVLMSRIGADPSYVFRDTANSSSALDMKRFIHAEQNGSDVDVHFEYAKHDATYVLQDAKVEEFEAVLSELRDGLAKLVASSVDHEIEKQIKTNAVANSFLKAVDLWPDANPSDIWWFIIQRAYCDPYNHPATYARLSFEQSWKRTGGWALEEIVVRHYGPELKKHGITIEIARGDRKPELSKQFRVSSRLESDKIDVFLLGPDGRPFGVVHVKASFAERRTDDVPMSEALIAGGYYSPLFTMDCKSTPSTRPVNRGELGTVGGRRSAKRKDVEDDGWFSACFSYNQNTEPTLKDSQAKARIMVGDFSNPDDQFVKSVVQFWKDFRTRN